MEQLVISKPLLEQLDAYQVVQQVNMVMPLLELVNLVPNSVIHV
jgi:hypothetical protein